MQFWRGAHDFLHILWLKVKQSRCVYREIENMAHIFILNMNAVEFSLYMT